MWKKSPKIWQLQIVLIRLTITIFPLQRPVIVNFLTMVNIVLLNPAKLFIGL